ncbi:exodeoxyribonuclease VII large subunit [Rhodoflexus sp.]
MQEKFFTLLQLNKSIRNLITGIGREFWITAEIAQLQIQEHAYLELVQKENERIVAKAKGIIWSNVLQGLWDTHGAMLTSILKNGAGIRCRVLVNFHEVHGLSMQIKAVDTFYTLGEMEQQRLQTLAKLEQNGLLYLQQKLSLPVVLQKIAVVSSESAAGFGDFMNQLENNPWGYRFAVTLFPASVQGEGAAAGLVEQIRRVSLSFDALAIIRGGGARLDLEVFNNEAVASAIARCPIPVLAGIGHQRDSTISDQTAYLSLKTPTAVAEFILQHNMQFEGKIIDLTRRIALYSSGKINEQKAQLSSLRLALMRQIHEKTSSEAIKQQRLQINIQSLAKNKLHTDRHRLEVFEQFFRCSNPKYLLKKGYFLIRKEQHYLKSADLQVGMQVTIKGESTIFKADIINKTTD